MITLVAFAFLFGIRPAPAADLVVGGACGTTIQACIDAAIAGDNVQVPAGTYIESLTLTKAVSLVGLGATPADTVISALGLSARVLLINGASIDTAVIIENLTFKDGVVTTEKLIVRNGAGILVFGDAQPTIRHVVIRDNTTNFDGAGLYADAGSPLTLLNVAFLDNVSVRAGGGAAFEDAATVTDCLFERNQSTNNVGGAIKAEGTTTISNTLFRDNVTATAAAASIGHGGAVYVFGADLTIEDCLFENNRCMESKSDGGAVYLLGTFTSPTLMLTNTDFVNNTAGRNGGGAHASHDVILNGGTFNGNHAPGSGSTVSDGGGGLFAGSVNATGTTFVSNTTGKQGGGMFVAAGPADLTNVSFDGNSATDGGGLAVRGFVGGATLINTNFTQNQAVEDGGAVLIEVFGLSIDGGQFVLNSATIGHGGGVFVREDLDVADATFTGNTAGGNGGGAYVVVGDGIIDGGIFQDNEANASIAFFNEGGGGIYIAAGNLTVDGTSFVANLAPSSLGGGAHVRGSANLNLASLDNNQSGRGGGGIFTFGALVVTDCQFTGNVVLDGSGGGAWGNAAVTATGGTFLGNRTEGAFGAGGGFRAAGEGIVNGTQFIANVASSFGGGMFVSGVVTLTGGLFQGNHSDGLGGGLASSFEPLMITGSTFLENTAESHGGALLSSGLVTIDASTFRDNSSTLGSGGGVYTAGQVHVMGNSEFVMNNAALDGGGIWANSGVVLGSARFEGNTSVGGMGGGVAAPLGKLETAGTLFLGNGAVGGGATFSFDVDVADTHFLDNQASGDGGGLWIRRSGSIVGSMLAGNEAGDSGGGIFRAGLSGSLALRVETCSVSGNTAGLSGGGIANPLKPLELANSTFSGNIAMASGGAVHVGATVVASLTNVTIVGNTASTGDALAATDSTVTVDWLNTLVVGTCDQAGALVTSLGGNLESAGNSCGFNDATDQTGITAAELNLAPLGDYGGPTQTHPLPPGSFALDAGVSPCPAVDQRGVLRSDGLCDVGAFEVSGCPADLDGNGEVRVPDLIILLSAWGPNPGHPADFNYDGEVRVPDLIGLLSAWGPCP